MLDTLGNLGDFIGGIAVVVTLIYLAIQVRQNTLALKAASWQEIVSGAREVAKLRGDPAIAPAWIKGLSSFPTMPVQDASKFGLVMTDETLFFQGVFALYQSRQLDESVYKAYRAWYASIVATPGGTQWWLSFGRPILVPEMVSEIDVYMKNGVIVDISKIYPILGAEEFSEDKE